MRNGALSTLSCFLSDARPRSLPPCHSVAKGLIARLLISDPDHRATAREALHNKWIAEDLVELRDVFEDCIASVDGESC